MKNKYRFEHSSFGEFKNFDAYEIDSVCVETNTFSENDYYKAINDKVIKKEDVNFVCSFYRLEFVLVLNAKFRIQISSII